MSTRCNNNGLLINPN